MKNLDNVKPEAPSVIAAEEELRELRYQAEQKLLQLIIDASGSASDILTIATSAYKTFKDGVGQPLY